MMTLANKRLERPGISRRADVEWSRAGRSAARRSAAEVADGT